MALYSVDKQLLWGVFGNDECIVYMYSVFCYTVSLLLHEHYNLYCRAVEGAEIKSARDWGSKETAKGSVLRFIAHCFC